MGAQSKAIAEALEQFVEKVVRRVQLRCFQAVISATPVDTGFARAGWAPAVGAPDDSGPEDRPRDEATARSLAAGLESAHRQKADEIAASYQVEQGLAFLTNPVRYVEFLNEGSSAQAPARFVEQAIAVGIQAALRDLAG